MQQLSPQPADNTQAKMMLYFMPMLLHRSSCSSVPAGLTLYIFVNNLLSIAQQQCIMRRMPAPRRRPRRSSREHGRVAMDERTRSAARRPARRRRRSRAAREFCEGLLERLGAAVDVEVKETPEAIARRAHRRAPGNAVELASRARRGRSSTS